MIGRATQLERVEELLVQWRAGQAQVLLISGKAGIGKSHVVAAAKEYASNNHAFILAGNAGEQDRGWSSRCSAGLRKKVGKGRRF